jgi:K+-transporting ATPase A subunit
MSPALAFDTAVSFTTNTSWQNYAGESTLGYLARQRPTSADPGALRTTQPAFVMLVLGVAVILVFLTFLPALALGPLAEGLH